MRLGLLLAFGLLLPVANATTKTRQEDPTVAIQRERSEPFCYFMYPTDQLGFEGCPKATCVTYDGAFLTPYGQFSFYAGSPNFVRPINKRVKTLLDGYLPVIQFGFDRDGLHYQIEAFATPVDLDPKNNLITFIRCEVSNPGDTNTRGILGVNFGDIAGSINADPNWPGFLGQRKSIKGALGAQRSTTWNTIPFMNEKAFDPNSTAVQFKNGDMIQSGHVVFTAPTERASAFEAFKSNDTRAALQYDFTLGPKASKTFDFKVPAVPIAVDRAKPIQDLENANPSSYREKTVDYWKKRVALADRFHVDDPKVENTFKTSLVNDLVAREFNPPDQEYQRVNKFQYNYMWIRDSSFFARTYDMLGMSDVARATLNPFMVWKDGKVVSFFKPGAPQPNGARLEVEDDYWGQVLWAVGAHYKTTEDKKFLEQVYPLLADHIHEFVEKCKKDPRGLWPVAGPYDNEAINGHYTGHSFWALLGLKYAVLMANAMNRPQDAADWTKVHDDYEANFLTQLRALTEKSEGYIPPGLDNVNDGNDWDNASGGIYPFEVLAPTDPIANKTLDMVRNYNYREGIITYGGNAWVAKNLSKEGKESPDGTLHHYEIFYVTESNTVRGKQKEVIEDLFSILAHTGSTNSGFEFGVPAWGSRDVGDNFTPHGWFASRYMAQIRDLLVREQGSELHIASALAPGWISPGKEVKVTQAPTFFGSVSYKLKSANGGATLEFSNKWKPGQSPSAIVFHVPWFFKATKAKIDGKEASFQNETLTIPSDAKKVELGWVSKKINDVSYEEAVRLYLEKYYRKGERKDGKFLFPSADSL